MLIFACISPHPPIILPSVGSPADRERVKKTIKALERLGENLAALKPDGLIISSPHPDWGFKVPLHFLNAKAQVQPEQVEEYLTTSESPRKHFEWGKEVVQNTKKATAKRIAWIASGDLSHYLKEDGPYGFRPEGPEFDKKLVELLERGDIEGILNLDPDFTERAGECGLRSICMLLGALSNYKYETKILSYEGPFGVGYLVAEFILTE